MKEIRTELEIDASADAVWAVLADFDRYGEWNPFIVKIRATPAPGTPVDFTGLIGSRKVKIQARMVEAREPRGFWWRGPRSRALGRLFRGEHYFEIHPLEERRCRFVHGERFSGWVVPLLERWLERVIRPTYERVNVALKRRVEASSG